MIVIYPCLPEHVKTHYEHMVSLPDSFWFPIKHYYLVKGEKK
jgi:hypothetical protein